MVCRSVDASGHSRDNGVASHATVSGSDAGTAAWSDSAAAKIPFRTAQFVDGVAIAHPNKGR